MNGAVDGSNQRVMGKYHCLDLAAGHAGCADAGCADAAGLGHAGCAGDPGRGGPACPVGDGGSAGAGGVPGASCARAAEQAHSAASNHNAARLRTSNYASARVASERSTGRGRRSPRPAARMMARMYTLTKYTRRIDYRAAARTALAPALSDKCRYKSPGSPSKISRVRFASESARPTWEGNPSSAASST